MSSYVDQPLSHSDNEAEDFDAVQGRFPRVWPQIFYHGTCGRCHHLHTARPVEVREDGSHQRVLCTHCENPLFGLGRNSTQTTLASVLTSSTWKHETDTSFEVPVGCTTTGDPGSAPLQNDSALRNQNGILSSRQSSLQVHGPDIEDRTSSKQHKKEASRKPTFVGSVKPDATPQDSTHRSQKGRKASKLKERFLRFVHNLGRPGPFRRRPQSPARPPDASREAAPPIQDTDSQVESPPPEGPLASHYRVASSESISPADFIHNGQDTDSVTQLRKRHRLHVFRREKTLKRKFLRRRRCCTANCACNTGNNASQARHTSPIDSNQPQPPAESRSEPASPTSSEYRPSTPCPVLERIRRTTDFLGAHLPDINYRSPSGREDSIQLEYARSSQSSASGGVSQATTAIDGRSTTSGIHHESSLFRRRSNRSPALLPDVRSHFLIAPRPDVVESMQRVDELGLSPIRRSTDQTDRSFTLPRRQSTRQSSSSESAGENNNSSSGASGSGSRANTANLSRLTTMIAELDASNANDTQGAAVNAGRPTPITEEPTPSNQTDEE